jgi:salicylate hydroxylase
VLNRLGLDKAISAKSFEPEGLDLYAFRGDDPLVTLKFGATAKARYGLPYAVMHRADLAEVLAGACRRFANIDIVFGVEHFDVAGHARGLSVLADEGNGQVREARAFAFVGADGVHSATRTDVLGGPAATPSGHIAWRVLLDPAEVEGLIAPDRSSVIMAPGYHAVCYPLPYRRKVNVVLLTGERAARGRDGSFNRAPALSRTAARNRRLAALLERAGERWGLWPLLAVKAENLHDGPIGLIGDAAHAMLPYQAQGAAMAIEDAAILAPLLMTEPAADAALRRYENLRRRRVERVAALSLANGRAFNMEWPFTLARDAVIRAQGPEGHLRRLDWLYGYDAAPEAEIGAPNRPS